MACGYYCTNWRGGCSRAGKYVWIEDDDPGNPPCCKKCGEEMMDEECYKENSDEMMFPDGEDDGFSPSTWYE